MAKGEWIKLRVSSEELLQCKAAAKAAGMTFSAWIRWALNYACFDPQYQQAAQAPVKIACNGDVPTEKVIKTMKIVSLANPLVVEIPSTSRKPFNPQPKDKWKKK